MNQDFILPDIGEGIVECELLKWLVSEGDQIVEDQPVAEVMTDKATVEIPAMHDGVVKKLYYQEGDIAKVHAPLFAMETDTSSVSNTEERTENQPAQDNSKAVEANIAASSNVETFILPDIGEGIVECEIVKWHVAENDEVLEDQVVVEVMTDKAVVEIPAKHAGVIDKLYYKQGDIAKVDAPLFDLRGVDSSDNTQAPAQSSANDRNTTQSRIDSVSSNKQGEAFEPPVNSTKPIASPAVRRLAKEQGINLSDISGSGKKGRILKQDVIHNENLPNSSTEKEQINQPTQKVASPSSEASTEDKVIPVKGVLAAMAKKMKASVYSIPHFTVTDELEMDALIQLREKLKPEFERENIKLSFMPFFIKALSLALTQYPQINARLNEEETEITYLASHNIGLAVDSKIGLLVPNIKNVQEKSIKQIAIELNQIINDARDGKLSNQALSGGSISISNIGAIGGMTATPIINKPDVAIVALGKTQKLPRFDEQDKVVAKHIMHLSWSGDHRVIDGATMVKFNNLWMDYLSQPEKMLINLR
ncbi:dihydrolipoyllysine-residue acetyltransferase [Glaciecola sp. 1036]|uniref:dihydrolipoyllysine-residue acetyltransferase n=1 Tax=Alteromonadaceae TaxID=72275 RepID=UPI003D08C025